MTKKKERLDPNLVKGQEADVNSGLTPTDYGQDNFAELAKRNPKAAQIAKQRVAERTRGKRLYPNSDHN